MATEIFFGIDPGIDITGFAAIERRGANDFLLLQCGVIRTDRSQSLSQRLVTLQADLAQVLASVSHPTLASVEDLFFSRNVKTALIVGQARGVILYTIEQAGIPLLELTPNQVKAAMTGSGNADKQQMQRMVMMQFGLTTLPQPDDAADAAAIALAGAFHHVSLFN